MKTKVTNVRINKLLKTIAFCSVIVINSNSVVAQSYWELSGNSISNTDYLGTNNNEDLIFKTNGIEGFRLSKTRDLGIGITVPQARLHINAPGGVDSDIQMGVNNFGHLIIGATKTPYVASIAGGQGAAASAIGGCRIDSYMPLAMPSGGYIGGLILNGLSNDNVIVGNPAINGSDLKVYGETYMSKSLDVNGAISLDMNGTIKSKKGWGDWLQLETSTGAFWRIHNPQTEDYLTFGFQDGATQTYSLKLHQDGSVGIGTGYHTGYLLSVGGSMRAGRILVSDPGGWSDFVFAKDYELNSLEEIEVYIEKNNHLPDVPSEQEVFENGFDLAKMDATLLQKIEELTLHMIAMNKRMKQLENENQELKK